MCSQGFESISPPVKIHLKRHQCEYQIMNSFTERPKTKKQYIQIQKTLKETRGQRDSLQQQTLSILSNIKQMRESLPLFIELNALEIASSRAARRFDTINWVCIGACREGVLTWKRVNTKNRKHTYVRYVKSQRILDLICKRLKSISTKRQVLIDNNLELYKASVELEKRAMQMHEKTLVEHASVLKLEGLLQSAPKGLQAKLGYT